MRYGKLVLICAAALLPVQGARAERKLIIGNQYDVAFGGTNQGSFSSLQLQNGLGSFYGFYPAIEAKSLGQTTEIGVSYAAFVERFNGDRNLTSLSHVAGADFAARPTRSLTLVFGGSFSSAPDYTSVDVLKGAAPAPDDFRFVFQPALAESTRHTFRGSAGTRIDLSQRSFITADFSALALQYQEDEEFEGLLLDQHREEARLGYWYRLSALDSVDVQYIFVQNSYGELGTGRSQAAALGYTRQITPALRVRFEAGPAHVSFDGTRYYGYLATASLTRTFRVSQISAYYDHSPGDSSGLGSLSDVHSAGVSVFAPLWRGLSIGSSFAGFRSRSSVNTSDRFRGFYGSVDLSYPMSRRWFLAWGGSYRINAFDHPSDQEYKRLYFSIRFRAPELWRTSL